MPPPDSSLVDPDVPGPKVSVLIVTYNHEKYILEAIDSALAQKTTFPVELVIGEDCSTDRTRDIVRASASRAAGRIRVLEHEKNVGLSENLRRTWAACGGRYIAILEGDDYWTDVLKLQRQADALDAHPDWSLCFHRAEIRNENGSHPFLEPAEDGFPAETGLDELLGRNFIVNATVMYRSGVVPDIPEALGRVVQQDWALHALHALQGRIGYLPHVMAVWRHHPGSLWSGAAECRRWEYIFAGYDLLEDLLGPQYRDRIREERLRHVRQLCTELMLALNSHDYRWGQTLLLPLRTLRRWLGHSPQGGSAMM